MAALFVRAFIGEVSEMKLWKVSSYLALAVTAACLLLNGCGSKTSAIVTSVSLTSSVGNTLILGQSTTLTATVTAQQPRCHMGGVHLHYYPCHSRRQHHANYRQTLPLGQFLRHALQRADHRDRHIPGPVRSPRPDYLSSACDHHHGASRCRLK